MVMTQADKVKAAAALSDSVVQVTESVAQQQDYQGRINAAIPVLLMRSALPNSEVGKVRSLLPEWQPGQDYKKGWLLQYEGEVYRIGQDLTSSTTYKPSDAGVTALYSHIQLDEYGYEIWQTYDGVSGAYNYLQVVYDSDAGKHYRSTVENTKNVWGTPSQQPSYWEEYDITTDSAAEE